MVIAFLVLKKTPTLPKTFVEWKFLYVAGCCAMLGWGGGIETNEWHTMM